MTDPTMLDKAREVTRRMIVAENRAELRGTATRTLVRQIGRNVRELARRLITGQL